MLPVIAVIQNIIKIKYLGAGLSGYRMKKRVGEVEEFVIERLTEEEGQGLHCVLCVSGWIEDREAQAFRHHWRHLWLSKEQYTLRWESKVKTNTFFIKNICLVSRGIGPKH